MGYAFTKQNCYSRFKRDILCIVGISSLFISTSVYSENLSGLTTGPKAEKAPPPSCEPPKKDPTAWDLSAAFGFNMTQGNSDTSLLTAGFDATKEKDDNIYIINIAGAEGTQESETTQRFIRGKAGYERLITERAYFAASGSFMSDEIADVDYRTIISPGAGYYLLKSEETKLAFETGPAYVFEKLGGVKSDYLAWRAANNFSWKFSPTAKLFQYAEYLLNTEETDQSLILAKAGLEASLTSTLALVLAIEDRFNSQPSDDRKKNDVLITSALKVSF